MFCLQPFCHIVMLIPFKLNGLQPLGEYFLCKIMTSKFHAFAFALGQPLSELYRLQN
jgi:hypothetical protein